MIDLNKIKFDERGLIPAVIQDVHNNEVLMVAYMNRESLNITLTEKRTCFFSRSRQKLWRKGETSGHIQKVKQILADCDLDCLVVKVEQVGAACHTNRRSCFLNPVLD